MNSDDPVGALVERTIENLRVLDDLSDQLSPSGAQVFEVTQMVNSLLSLLVVPRELGTLEFVGRAGRDPHVFENGIRAWHSTQVHFTLKRIGVRPPQSLKKLLGGMRNSVAHAAFMFTSDDEGEITEIEFTHRSRSGEEQWSVTFGVRDLRTFMGVLAIELRSAREHQLAQTSASSAASEVAKSDVTFQLPTETLERIQNLVRAGEVASVGRFVEAAVAARLLDDEEISAA